MAKKELTCIACPSGCQLTYEITDDNEYLITGNDCTKGPIYLRQEVTEPKRMVASTVKIKSEITEVIPVYTDVALKKEYVHLLIEKLNEVEIKAPIKYQDIIIENIFQTGVNICASKTVDY